MDNNKLDAQLRRDTATANGLQADKALYAALEDDLAPLRDEHAANLAKARDLEAAVMSDDAGTVAAQKTSAKALLKPLAYRLAAALQGYAASKLNPDGDLAGRVRYSRSQLSEASDANLATMVGALLKEAQPLAAPLAKREFTAADLAETTRLLARFEQKQASHRLTQVEGSTERKTLIALLRRNANLIKEMRTQLKAYQNSPTKHEVWLRFQGYTRLITLGGGGPKGDTTTLP
ncbi:hypothetical protein [Hymenobacter negativus]|uniref:hypothetical protein n=1 Tax=Hymenobacter negativus TaxID=2795026 RepID=UPI001F34A347|nr:hypothetical protein [Hymenobacter negativus]